MVDTIDWDKVRDWIFDNMPVETADYTRREFETDVSQHIESYPKFPKDERTKIWESVKDLRKVEEVIEEHKKEKGFLSRLYTRVKTFLRRHF